MNKITEFIKEGTVTLKTVESPINGELVVKWDTISGYQILGGGLWQVGGPVEEIWKIAFKKIPDSFIPKRILILGLGGGTIAKLARKKWKESQIVGVDIDETIVNLGKDYLGLNKLNVETHITDASLFIKKNKDIFDLICVDMYVGSSYPEKFEGEEFIKVLQKSLSKKGLLAVNRLYYGKKRALSEKFLKKLQGNFTSVIEVFPKFVENVIYLSFNGPVEQ